MAEAVATTATALDCPVCSNLLDEPKILKCTHRICQGCLLRTLKARTENAIGCPVCQHPILPENATEEFDLDAFVKHLRTDHISWTKAKSQQVLSSEAVCSVCDSQAVSFCISCDTKLCHTCTKCHNKLLSSAQHSVEDLSTLTVEKLAAKKRMPCSCQQEKIVEKFCGAHMELVCTSCARSNHKTCEGIEDVEVFAEKMRKNLAEQSEKLKQKGASLADEVKELNSQIATGEVEFKKMKERVISTFVEIIKCYEAEKHKVLDEVEKKEQAFLDTMVERRDAMAEFQTYTLAKATSIDDLISTTPDTSLLATSKELESQLDNRDKEKALSADWNKARVGEVHFNEKVLNDVKSMAGNICEVQDSPPQENPSGSGQLAAAATIHAASGFGGAVCGSLTPATPVFGLPICHSAIEHGGPVFGSLTPATSVFRLDDLPIWEDTFQFIIPVSELRRNGPEKIYEHELTDLWCLCARNEDSQVFFSVLCDLPQHFRSWSCHVEGSVNVLAADFGEDIEEDFKHIFHQSSKSKDVGDGWNVLNHRLGFVEDGRLTVELTITVKRHKGLGQWFN